MPVMDGFQATRALRRREARLSLRAGKPVHTPVIAITATADYKQKCIDAEMDDWMPKPFNKDKLCHVLNRWLGKCDVTGESDNQGESKKTTPQEERRRAGDLERDNSERGQVEEQEEMPEIGEARETPPTKGEAREDEEKAHQGQRRRRRRRRRRAGAEDQCEGA